MNKYDYIVVGGGIAGVTCAEYLEGQNSNCKILILSTYPLIKKICNLIKFTKHLETFDVCEQNINEYKALHPNIDFFLDTITHIDFNEKTVFTKATNYYYNYSICIAAGSSPTTIQPKTSANFDVGKYIYTLKDTESVEKFQENLKFAKTIAIVGNGGIATEIVYKIQHCKVYWIIKDENVTHKFLSEGASEYLIKKFLKDASKDDYQTATQHENLASIDNQNHNSNQNNNSIPMKQLFLKESYGSALGPNWHLNLNLYGGSSDFETNMATQKTSGTNHVKIIYNAEINQMSLNNEYKGVTLTLSNGQSIQCDLVISATGVLPNSHSFTTNPKLKLNSSDGDGILVDQYMRTSIKDVFAAGDICSVDTSHWAPNWFQMRLWDQAYHMGYLAALNMSSTKNTATTNITNADGNQINIIDNDNSLPLLSEDFYFELFTHTTNFFGQSIILLGLFNPTLPLAKAQNTDSNHDRLLNLKFERMIRVEDDHYIELILADHPDNNIINLESKPSQPEQNSSEISSLPESLFVRGAIIIGPTEMEETIENLILDKINVAPLGADLLNPNIDIDDYFD